MGRICQAREGDLCTAAGGKTRAGPAATRIAKNRYYACTKSGVRLGNRRQISASYDPLAYVSVALVDGPGCSVPRWIVSAPLLTVITSRI